ncbi:nitrate- and nitrite sensing domain-containing protein [Sphaerisporangium sp. TRM90804]|uniref:sensor histidine kinase n=1 Tax=Sphaerisporangium sp. TRM90804 TaxID=3031113 RepID=UPI002448E3C1|nr:nitrate- and nitrite sensing domain-containing protein [Sphaerisporangium sp. TRM90804]MDH2430078.1 nitrate- and nitrite sensing domain-containing protein [Sphaerisporangium sp. TRM90804]
MERSGPSTPRTPKSGSWLRLRNWRVRSRLIALIIIPTIVGVILGAVQLTDAVATSNAYRRLTEVAQLVEKIDVLIHEVDKERDLTAWYIAEGRRQARFKRVRAQQDAVDQAREPVLADVSSLDDSHTARVRSEAEQIRRWLEGLPGLRTRIADPTVPSRAALGMYSALITVLQSMQAELGTAGDDQRLLGDSIALGALSRAKEEVSRQRGLMTVGLTTLNSSGGGFDYDDFVDFPGSWSRQESETSTFLAEATPADVKFYNETVRGQQVDKADWMRALALAQLRQFKEIQDLDPLRRDDTSLWYSSTTAVADRMRRVEERLVSSVVQQSRTLQEEAQRQALISGALILVLLLLVLVITAVVASSLTRPLRRLRAEALEIAGSRLPETVQRLRESSDSAPTAEVVPIGVNSRDEMGEVARAFDEVHREAIRLAGDEARLRSNVNAMFVNLSRRSQTLVERQLSLIDGLEQGEQDESRLGNLFKLDHLATRMRRNSENLLVLAGQEPSRRWSQPVPLVDIVRASLSEVESYERVDVRVQSGTSVIGQAVNDAVHLVAELVENAISFSPRETKVVVSSNRIDGGGVMISVSDSGIGMTADELAEANWRLANPPVVDVSVSRRMGLFVVGRLALRHNIRVQLRQQDAGGLTAMVLLPEGLLATSGAPQYPGMPMEAAGAGQFGAPSQAAATSAMFGGGPGGPGGFEQPGMRAPVFGADAPGVGAPSGPSNRGPFERGPFERPATGNDPFDQRPGARDPFERAPGGRGMFDSPPAERGGPGRGAFDRDEPEQDPFDRYFNPNPPLDTPWPADVPAPGSGPAGPASGPWPGLADQDTASWPAVPSHGGPAGPVTGNQAAGAGLGGPMTGPQAGPRTGPSGGPMTGPVGGMAGPMTGPGTAGPATGPAARSGHPFGGLADMDHTGPLPTVHSSPLDGSEEFLPIFAAVESDWFRRSDGGPDTRPGPGRATREAEPVQAVAAPVAEAVQDDVDERSAEGRSWSSPGDAGWQAARAASDPSLGGITSSGLPKRVPKANLVPGSADPGPSAFTPQPSISPDRVRSRMASFQQGVRKGRAVARGEAGDDPSPPNRNVESNKEDS